jgi:serine protease Do
MPQVGDHRTDILPLADANKIIAGTEVYAIATPGLLSLSPSVTKGIIGGVGRLKEPLGKEFIQTDVQINPGNSGGPLINSKGEILGIVSLKIVSQEKCLEGLAFCIPIDLVSDKLGILIK